jgi:hypothetical protein
MDALVSGYKDDILRPIMINAGNIDDVSLVDNLF